MYGPILINHTNPMKTLKHFLIYGIIGLVLEVIYTGIASFLKGDYSMQGFTFLVMLPIYGLAVFLEPLHTQIRTIPWWIRGAFYLTLIWLIEYSSGLILAIVLGHCPWHYTDSLNINGLITLKMAPEWFLAGLGFEYLHDYLDKITI
ncbi:putative ABC transporter permease [Desulfosporosinus sp. SYSU MS00001]|uniref:putative ABC transporter permease n=1 Tax=Desulfosporosinus sp. SYSU MS00001 TaxID=3416284 RepID=UPI003CEF559D